MLCGESNGVKYSRDSKAVHDDFRLRKSIPEQAKIILNPVHDRMTRFEMNLKREFLSKNDRWVISVWNKGKVDKNGKVKDGKRPAWTIFYDGKEKAVESIPEFGVEIGILDIVERGRMGRTETLGAIKKCHIEETLRYVDEHCVPKRRNSTKYSLRHEGRLYPPKYLIAVAGKLATGRELTTEDHSGGEGDSNKKLRQLGFTDIVRQPSDRPEC